MTWLAWRQFRTSALVAAIGVAALELVLGLTGAAMRQDHADLTSGCRGAAGARGGGCSALEQQFFHEHRPAFLAVTLLVLAAPALVGLFWGAPLVAHELETGTHKLVWHQSVSRVRWLAVKLAIVGTAGVALALVVSLTVSAWAAPLDGAGALDFARMEPILFAARGAVPAGYAAVAFTAGVLVGILVRRTVPAMAVTLALLAALLGAAPLVRAHLVPPVHAAVEISDGSSPFDLVRVGPDRVALDAGESGAWVLSTQTVDVDGTPVDAIPVSASGPCASPQQDRDACFAEMRDLGHHIEVTYQPADRFWQLQLLETVACAALALALTALSLRLVRRPR